MYSNDYDNSKASEKYNIFTEIVTKAIKISTPKVKKVCPSKYRNPVAWWDSECDTAITLRKDSLKKWKFTRDLKDSIELKKIEP